MLNLTLKYEKKDLIKFCNLHETDQRLNNYCLDINLIIEINPTNFLDTKLNCANGI